MRSSEDFESAGFFGGRLEARATFSDFAAVAEDAVDEGEEQRAGGDDEERGREAPECVLSGEIPDRQDAHDDAGKDAQRDDAEGNGADDRGREKTAGGFGKKGRCGVHVNWEGRAGPPGSELSSCV
jgi:hypothetical protein